MPVRLSPISSRVVRTGLVLGAALASVATFGGEGGWEQHVQLENAAVTTLSSSTGTWNDDFHAKGAGTGARRVRLEGAVELTPSAPLAMPVEVRVRFVPVGGGAIDERTIYLVDRQVYTAVEHEVTCQAGVACNDDGTFEVQVVTPAALGSTTLDLHWVATASVYGRGPAAPADAALELTQP